VEEEKLNLTNALAKDPIPMALKYTSNWFLPLKTWFFSLNVVNLANHL